MNESNKVANGNGDFAYWDNSRTQPAGETEESLKQQQRHREQQLEALSSFFERRSPPPQPPQVPQAHYPYPGYIPPQQMPPTSVSLPGKGMTLTISTDEMILDIKITPRNNGYTIS